MATVKRELHPEEAQFRAGSFPQYQRIVGSFFPLSVLSFDASTSEGATWKLAALNYGSGNLTLTVYWYADTATSGGVVWQTSIAAVTANTDTGDVQTKALASVNTAADTHLGTTGQRLHSVDVTITNLDSLAANDVVWLMLERLPGDASDTMTGDAHFVMGVLAYSDS